jgi:hypothetical protein
MAEVRRTGDWALARRLISRAPHRLEQAIGTALRQEAHELRKEIVVGLTNQAPGGTPIRPLSPLTIAARQLSGFNGTKALIERADLRNAVTVVVQGFEAFIGVPRKARSKDDKSLEDVAKVHEFGSGPIVIPLTPKMRRFLFVLLNKTGIEPTSTGQPGKGVVVTEVPARPFIRPAFDVWRTGAQGRFLRRIAAALGWKV